MNIAINGPKILFKIPVGDLFTITITQTTLSSCIVTWALILACYLLGRKLTKRPGGRQVIAEKLVTMLYDLVEDTMGSHNLHFAPYMRMIYHILAHYSITFKLYRQILSHSLQAEVRVLFYRQQSAATAADRR
jgi:F0F1-type ATP synthase membrane subunit a